MQRSHTLEDCAIATMVQIQEQLVQLVEQVTNAAAELPVERTEHRRTAKPPRFQERRGAKVGLSPAARRSTRCLHGGKRSLTPIQGVRKLT